MVAIDLNIEETNLDVVTEELTFEGYYNKYLKKAQIAANRVLQSNDFDCTLETGDLVSVGFTNMYKNGSWKNDQNGNLLYTTIKNEFINRARKYKSEKRNTNLNLSMDNNLSGMEVDFRETVSYEGEFFTDTEKAIEKAESIISKLDGKELQCMREYAINGLKYEEIAEKLDIPMNTVKTNINRGRKKLQKLRVK